MGDQHGAATDPPPPLGQFRPLFALFHLLFALFSPAVRPAFARFRPGSPAFALVFALWRPKLPPPAAGGNPANPCDV